MDAQKKQLRAELKQLKQREKQLADDYGELEDENITLQKQISSLKSAQLEYDGMQYEISRLLEDSQVLQASNDEANQLKQIAIDQVKH